MSILTQLAEQFRAQRPAPPAPYTFPTLTHNTYPDLGFQIADTVKGSGWSVKNPTSGPISDSRFQSKFNVGFGFRFALGRGAVAEMSLFASLSVSVPGMPAVDLGLRNFDPYPDFAFKVNIEGVTDDVLSGHFQKFDGFDLEVESIEYKTGEDAHVHKRPGVPKYSSIKLSKGLIANTKLWNWCMETARGKLTRRNITITVLPETRNELVPLVAYNFIGCWPTKWSGLRLDGKGQGTIVEDLEFVVDYVELAK